MTGRRRPPAAGWLLLLVPVLWGATFPAAKIAIRTLDVLPFTAWSRLIGFTTILLAIPWLARGSREGRVTRTEVWRAVGPGAVLGTLIFAAYVLQTVGLERTTATNAGFITGLYVVFTPVLGLALFRQPAGRRAWVAVGISVVGLALLSFEDLGALRARPGDLLVLASAVVWAGQVVAIGRFATRHPVLVLALGQMGFSAALHLAAAAPVGIDPAGAAEVWPLLVVTGILGSGVAFTLQLAAQRDLSAPRAAIILAGESVASAGFSFVWLGERLLSGQWLGAGLVVAAMVTSELGARRAEIRAEAAAPT
ncbi:MAG: DMT family transporter [Actinomycetota bacterium]